MNQLVEIPRSHRPMLPTIRSLAVVGLVELLLIQGVPACDVCLQPPKVPFTTEYPAAIEIAMATREAIDTGKIELDPLLSGALPSDRQVPQRLGDVSPQHLIKLWAQTQPARRHSHLRLTVDIVFIDVNKICHLDFRLGTVLYDAGQSGPSNIRLLTTKAGFYRMLLSGLETCERQGLVTIEEDDRGSYDALSLLFPERHLSDLQVAHVN